jgi:ferric enterobactin receptor
MYSSGSTFLTKSFVVLVLCTASVQLLAQSGAVKGKVLDSLSSEPLGFASIRIYQSVDKKLINGNITSETGDFAIELPAGKYYGQIEFMGYKTYSIEAFSLTNEYANHDIGLIKLAASANVLDEVVVQAQKSSMELSLDKKVFNVGQDLANAGGNATDILTNIPSVSVDPEGNIKLRGSDNVRILIDGKPSGLVSFKGGSGLQQLQANMIERVEVITNPSARYEAEGMAGIINIVLKKNNAQGFNAIFDVIVGYPNNLGGAANVNYRHKKMNFFVNYGISYRKQPGLGSIYQRVYSHDTTFILKQNNRSSILGFNNNIRGGLDYYFNEKSILTASYLFRRSDATRITNIHYEDYYFTTSSLSAISTRRQDETEQEPNSEYSIVYKKSFEQKGHDLIGEVKFLDNWESSDQVFAQHFYQSDNTEDFSKAKLQKSLNDEFEKQLLLQVDYTRPLGKDRKLETGLRTSLRNMINDYIVSEENNTGEFIPLPGLDNVFEYRENILAAYGIFANKVNRISYQVGLRVESTDVKTTLRETNEVNPRKYVNLFPSAHFTLNLANQNALQVSYSRRVRRPFYNDLSPFMTFADSRNFFSGNPNLNPEFSNVVEVGHMKYFEKGSFASSLYYRNTEGKMERIRTVDDEGNSRTLPQNLLSERSYGIEFTSEYALTPWWKLDFNFNFFHSYIDGSNIQEDYKTTTYSWFARQTSRFSLPHNFDVQLRGNYEAEQKTAQGRRKALYYADFSISKDVFKGRGTINFNVLDIFNTRKVRSVMKGTNFYTESQFQARRRQINLTVSYRIKQTKQAKKAVAVEE